MPGGFTRKNEKLAHKKDAKIPNNFLGLLEVIGNPFYKTLSLVIVFLLFVFYGAGGILRNIFQTLRRYPKSIRLPKFSIKIRAPKVSLPKITLPKPRPLLSLFVLGLILFSSWIIIFKDLPHPKELTNRDQEVSTKIYDRNGVLLYKIYQDKNRTIIPLSEIPKNVQLATLAAEDAEFYIHPGFSVRGILRAIVRNVTRGELAGGSTITQQLVKNALLSSEKTLVRKVRELVLAVGVEIYYTKEEILEMYLNEVSYGGTAYGIQEASRVYFGRDAERLNLEEAALLAGLPKSPTKFSPFGATPEGAKKRQEEILKLMRINKYITQEQEERANNKELNYIQNTIDIKAPHFVMYVRQILEEKYGREVVEKGGLTVVTTLDYEIQKTAEEVVRQEVESLWRLNVTNGAALVTNPKTGEILAMVGSRDYFDVERDGNVNVVTRERQPGSSIKLINYAYALSNGFTPATIIPDTPITFQIPGSEPYSPRNYDNTFKGPLSLRNVFAQSRNVPAVRVLATYGVEKMVEMGRKMGITTWEDLSRFGLSLTLGGGDVKLIDLAVAYSVVANQGEKAKLNPIIEVTNYRDRVLEKNKCTVGDGSSCNTEQILDPRVAFLLTSILSDNIARSPAFGSYSLLNIRNHPEIAVKTGTSNNLRDNLAIGFNQDRVVAVWVGNNDNSPMARVASGVTGATPIFNKIMTSLLKEKMPIPWTPPDGLLQANVCTLTGTLTCNGCPSRLEWFLKEDSPRTRCSTETIAKIKKDKEKKKLLEEAASTSRE